jgi:NAD(P)-dependent dehydrogenase (short-subunit alcohol dehydrogenase family)
MYATGLPDFDRGHGLELPDAKYDGTRQYAIAKRAQVTLNEMWASNAAARGVAFHAMHPGWADTPGVATSIPVFRAVTRPILRNAAQGADTISWLAGTEPSAIGSGGFWCDRAQRPIHRLGATRRRDTPEARHRLWELVNEAALGSFS